MFNAKIRKKIQTEQNARHKTVTSDVITMAHSSCVSILNTKLVIVK